MNSDIEELAGQLRQQGPQRYAAWNDDAFVSYVKGPVASLTQNLKWRDKGDPDTNSVANLLRLVSEGIGAGWLRTINDETPPPTFLAHCLATLVPYQLAMVPRSQRSEVLRNVWNLGEGLAREPQWLNQYVITQTNWSTELLKLDQLLATMLAPVLSPLPPARWNSGYKLQVLNLREKSATLVPGRMYLASPAVLCVEDRINSGETLGILLQKSGQSTILGSVGRLPEHAESFDQPAIVTDTDTIRINGQQVAAPLITSPRQTLCVASGFVIVSAEDSQRLWLVEAA